MLMIQRLGVAIAILLTFVACVLVLAFLAISIPFVLLFWVITGRGLNTKGTGAFPDYVRSISKGKV